MIICKFFPHAILHFRKENGQWFPESVIMEEIDRSEDKETFLLDGVVVAELDEQEVRIVKEGRITKRIARAELSEDRPYTFTMPSRF